jgi:transposase
LCWGQKRVARKGAVCHAIDRQKDGTTSERGQARADKRTYFPFTTAAQRRLLFETWEATGNVDLACQRAHVGRRPFYYWKPRVRAGGYAALERFASRAPRLPRRIAPEVAQRVQTMHDQHPEWGKQRLADELAKANGWVPLVSPNTVKRILRDAGLWSQPAEEKRGGRRA